MIDLLSTIEGLDLQAWFFVAMMGMIRAVGLTIAFLPFIWALNNAMTVRLGVAFAISLPVIYFNQEDLFVISRLDSPGLFTVMVLKEFGIGYGLGLLASVPFLAAQYAGSVVDSYRGQSDAGETDPTGGTLQTTSTLFLVVLMFAFVVEDGFFLLTKLHYLTYTFWPLTQVYPTLSEVPFALLAEFVSTIFYLSLLIAGPVMLVLLFWDLIFALSDAMGRKFRMAEDLLTVKNLAYVLMLPLLAIFILRIAPDLLHGVTEGLMRLEYFVR